MHPWAHFSTHPLGSWHFPGISKGWGHSLSSKAFCHSKMQNQNNLHTINKSRLMSWPFCKTVMPFYEMASKCWLTFGSAALILLTPSLFILGDWVLSKSTHRLKSQCVLLPSFLPCVSEQGMSGALGFLLDLPQWSPCCLVLVGLFLSQCLHPCYTDKSTACMRSEIWAPSLRGHHSHGVSYREVSGCDLRYGVGAATTEWQAQSGALMTPPTCPRLKDMVGDKEAETAS
jgi:hypothetical protein